MIVTNRPPRRKRPAKPAQAVTIAVPRVVRHTPQEGKSAEVVGECDLRFAG